jgi:carbon monoxide dehydrogenase subunit G
LRSRPAVARIHTPDPNRSTTLADLERTFIVMTPPEAAFDILSDPVRLPEYVPTLRLEDSIAIEGEADADAVMAKRDGAPEAGFAADRKTRTMTWGRPEHDYHGSITVTDSTSSTANVTVRLHTRDDADAEAVGRVFDQSVASIRRILSGR